MTPEQLQLLVFTYGDSDVGAHELIVRLAREALACKAQLHRAIEIARLNCSPILCGAGKGTIYSQICAALGIEELT